FLNDMDPHDVNFVSRYLVVDEFPETVANGHELTAIGEVMKNYIRFDLSVPMVARFLRIRFDNLSHACEAQYILEQLGYVVKFSTMHDHAKAKGQESTTCDVFEGQIRLSLTITTQLSLDDLTQQHQQELLSVAQFVAQCYGTVRDQSLYQIAPLGQGVFQATFRIEFQSIDSASRCVPGLTAFPVKGPSRAFTWYTHSVSYWTDTTPNPSPQPPRVDAHGRLIGFLRTEVQERAIIPSRHPADQHNRVTAPRILDGNDTRTTVMLRNIPNKLDWMALKQILDRYCFGLYDFIYLRIDFSSGNNVGYAFINFINTNGVLAILDKLDGKTWDGWRSGKAAEVSYATIQGKDALIQKFRNSSVMREAPYCRPRLFFSYEDEGMNDFNLVRRLGCDAPFPEPDNPAKLSRSMENARSVGLFPAHGANEMEHRNRHSMYDRGTPRDQIQSAMYQASAAQGLDLQLQGEIQRWFGYQNQHTYTTPFDRIPSNAIQQFFAANPWVLPGGNAVAHNP
ncbi:RNA recognition motif 2-domain-containing protein, partial [Lophiotrema nucula]